MTFEKIQCLKNDFGAWLAGLLFICILSRILIFSEKIVYNKRIRERVFVFMGGGIFDE
ncbi:hypothetical protein BSG1_09793 [Bacillus sp. SG-1]|nr:hypothetical protein BSG1_09793 [Bacillus sp. SG-1]